MHHFIYPSKDTYITNETNYLSKNLGRDEILELKANTQLYRTVTVYTTASVSQSYHVLTDVNSYSGSIDGYISGSASQSKLVISGSANIISSGSYSGILSGSKDGSSYEGIISALSGHFSGSLTGSLTGGFNGFICDATGSIGGFNGVALASVYGSQSIYSPNITFTNEPALSRILLKFDVTSISQSISNGNIENTGSLKFKLKLKLTDAAEIPLQYSVYGYPISQSWEMGDGQYETGGSDLGTSWTYKNFSGDSGSYWYNEIDSTIYNYIDYLNIAANATESFKNGGGTWYYNVPSIYTASLSGFCSDMLPNSGLIVSQSFDYEKSDINLDVTNIVKSWICGCVPNQGIILLSSLELSQAETESGTFKFFSSDTNTIYSPYLDVQWDDSEYITGSLSSISEAIPFTVVVKDLNKNYKFGTVPKINVYAREKAPLKNFVKGVQMNQYLTSSLLPSSSYYAIKDNENESMILDFDDSTKLSCNGNMHYFILDTTSFAHERFYRILIKVVTEDTTQIFDNGNIFKITR